METLSYKGNHKEFTINDLTLRIDQKYKVINEYHIMQHIIISFIFFLLSSQMSYYENINDFEGLVPKDGAMPKDFKRLIEHTRYDYYTRYYFFSPSMRCFYRYYKCKNPENDYSWELSGYQVGKSFKYNFIPDCEDGTPKTDTYHDSICVCERFLKRTANMKKLILPSLRK